MLNILHTLFPKRCAFHIHWDGNTLICSKCGAIIGFRYRIGDVLHIFIFPQYVFLRPMVLERPDTYRVNVPQDVLGSVTFVDFETAIREMKMAISDFDAALKLKEIEIDKQMNQQEITDDESIL